MPHVLDRYGTVFNIQMIYHAVISDTDAVKGLGSVELPDLKRVRVGRERLYGFDNPLDIPLVNTPQFTLRGAFPNYLTGGHLL